MQNIFYVAGGLGLFLYGMKMMSDGLENMAGNRLSAILERATSNRFLGVLVGIGITCVVQSSTAATVMVVGFVNASLMTLAQSVGVIMGVNIGTSITTQIVSFKIDQFAPLFIFIGALLYLIFRKRKLRNLGYVILGFGILLFGFSVMSSPLKEFAMQDSFRSMLTAFQNPMLALLAGMAFTVIIQSSTASIGVIIALLMGGVDMPFQTAAFLVLGCNIGTCLTTLLVSISASRESKRAAVVHLLYSVIGCVIFGPLLVFIPGILAWIQNVWPDEARQVAMFHTLFNTATLVLLLPFVKQLTWLVQKMIPEKPAESVSARRLKYFDPLAMKTPEVSVGQARREINRMGKHATANMQLALDAFYAKDSEKAMEVFEKEKNINFLHGEIISWLARLRGAGLSESFLEKTEMMLQAVSSMERIGDYAENIAEYTGLEEKYASKLSPAAVEDLTGLSETVTQLNALALDIFDTQDKIRLPQVDALKRNVDLLSNECLKSHVQRLKDKVCDPRGGMVFTDIVLDLRHCADHATNIAYSVLGAKAWDERRGVTYA